MRYEYVPTMPQQDPTYRYPIGHMHVDATAPHYEQDMRPYEDKPLRSIHFPTGRISLEDFIELLIVEFHVPTLALDGDEEAAIQFGLGHMTGNTY